MRGNWRNERGVTMVLFALLITVMFMMVAIVIELAAVRNDKQSNKSAADFAVAAGMRGLENSGSPQPWKGVCEARSYLQANEPAFSTFSTQTYMNGKANSVSDPCADTGNAPYTTLCNEDASQSKDTRMASWAWFRGVSANGRLTVDIKSGYDLSDGSFTDEPLVSGDDSLHLGCDQLAVIVTETQPRGFSKVIGSDELSTRMRSVGRVTIGQFSEDSVALLLLERSECRAAITTGGALIEVLANVDGLSATPPNLDKVRPGRIHVDSDGLSCSKGGGEYVIEGVDLDKSNGVPDPSIKAYHAIHPVTKDIVKPALISTRALPSSAQAHTAWPDTVGEPEPTSGSLISRSPIDKRYLNAVTTLDQQVTSLLAPSSPPAGDSAWEVVSGANCSPTASVTLPVDSTKTKLWFDCSITVGANVNLGIRENVTDLVVEGSLHVSGTDAKFSAVNPRNVAIFGDTAKAGVTLGTGGVLSVNTGDPAGLSECGNSGAPERTAVLSVLHGGFEWNQGTAFLCQTFVYLMNEGGKVPSSIGTAPSNYGAAPSDKTYNGYLNVGGSGKLIWSAPNAVRGRQPTAADLAASPFEDLGLWSETGRLNTIGGGGGLDLAGVYFLPNAPFKINGSSGQTIDADAQFVVRRLQLNGATTLKMAPSPDDSVPIPIFEGFTLVR